jgi:F-type H+-transporting ATPase subunit gamma
MANLRDIRRRIKSVKNTSQITKAMQMVAATKMRRAQQSAIALRPYSDRLDELTANLYANIGPAEVSHPLLQKRSGGKTGVIVLTTEKGLCGPLNTNLLRDVLKNDSPDKVYISVGKKGRQVLVRLKKNLLADFELKDTPTLAECKAISRLVLDKFKEGAFDSVEIYYNHFVNTLSQVATRFPLIPIGAEHLAKAKSRGAALRTERENVNADGKPAGPQLVYNFEPDAAELLGQLLPYYIHLLLYDKVLESRASEHSARMVAMKAATDNAKQLVKDLTLEYNKARQAAITNEILEISSAAAAMS